MIKPGNNQLAAGICHAKGSNSNLPQQWLMYITAENIEESIKNCKKLGGKIVTSAK